MIGSPRDAVRRTRPRRKKRLNREEFSIVIERVILTSTRSRSVGGLAALLCWLSIACGRDEATAPAADGRPRRGDTVVVERSAAVFFEARVLSVSETDVKVEAASDGRSSLVALGDVYRVPGTKTAFKPGEYAICRRSEREWTACRVRSLTPAAIDLEDANGELLRLPPESVLAPTPVTSLNIERHFEHAGRRREFLAALARAGAPRRPPQWNPEPTDEVVARDETGWYSARAAGEADGGARVMWDSERGTTTVAADRIVPPPPYLHAFVAGDFALLEPSAGSQPWKPVRVEAVQKDLILVTDEAGGRHEVSSRKLIPIR